jgi:hypothetical protein
MTSLRNDQSTRERLDWKLLQMGPVTLYWRRTYLDEDCAELGRLGYDIVRYDCRRWETMADFHREVPRLLRRQRRGVPRLPARPGPEHPERGRPGDRVR